MECHDYNQLANPLCAKYYNVGSSGPGVTRDFIEQTVRRITLDLENETVHKQRLFIPSKDERSLKPVLHKEGETFRRAGRFLCPLDFIRTKCAVEFVSGICEIGLGHACGIKRCGPCT